MKLQALPRDAFLRQRWDRIGLGVRLAYNPWHPAVIGCYLQAGAHLVRCGAMPEAQVQQRMLCLLLRTADDEALPWAWRSACLEHQVLPLARLVSLARQGRAADPAPWQAQAQAVAERLQQALSQRPDRG